MIHAIGKELEAKLRATGYLAATVVDGPERRKPNTFGQERIVIEYDEDGADQFASVHGLHKNPKHRATCKQACKLTIWAQAAQSGALEFEHKRRAAHIRDLAVVALNEIAHERKNLWTPASGHFVTPEDLKASEERTGAVYELKFTFDRGIAEQKWNGDFKPKGSVTKVTNTTQARLVPGPSDQIPEIGCGGE